MARKARAGTVTCQNSANEARGVKSAAYERSRGSLSAHAQILSLLLRALCTASLRAPVLRWPWRSNHAAPPAPGERDCSSRRASRASHLHLAKSHQRRRATGGCHTSTLSNQTVKACAASVSVRGLQQVA